MSRTTNGAAGLKRGLKTWEAIGISLALTAPSLAINIAPQGSAGLVGKSVPLTFLLATIGILLIAYTFVRLTQRFNHSGSVYGFVGATLGARAGVLAGWLLAGVYLLFVVITAAAAGKFTLAAIQEAGGLTDARDWVGFLFSAVALVVVWLLATRPVRGASRTVLIAEITTVTLIVVVSAFVLVRLLNGTAPHGQSFDWSVFSFPSGNVSDAFLGIVFGFLAFAGFEAAATLGDEAENPRRAVPRAILGTVIFAGVFFTVVSAVEVNGFGTDAAGVKSFIGSGSLLGDLGSSYAAPWIGELITIGAAVSALASSLASAVGASRVLYALGSDGAGPKSFGKLSTNAVPARAVGAVVIATAVVLAFSALVLRTDPFTVFATAGTTGTLLLLVVYGLATVGASRLLFFTKGSGVRVWEVVIPSFGIIVIAYTLFRNVWPLPQGAAWWGLGPALVWIVVSLAFVIARGDVVRRAGEKLAESEGLRAAGSTGIERDASAAAPDAATALQP